MEGNFYVSASSVEAPAKGRLARAYTGCHLEADAYGACVEKAHYNKELVVDSCKQLRQALRACIDRGVAEVNAATAVTAAAAANQPATAATGNSPPQ
jgi:hypothetical protein